jgi:hypothetical protein
MSEPVINLFLTAIIVPASVGVLGYASKKMFDSWKAGWKEAEDMKQKNFEEWRASLKESLRIGSETMSLLREQLSHVVTRADCDDAHSDIIEKLEDHGERLTILEVKVEHLEKKGG